MTNSKSSSRWFLSMFLSAALSVAVGCGDDGDDQNQQDVAGKSGSSGGKGGSGGAGGSTSSAGGSTSSAGGSKAATDPDAAKTCPDKVYDALSEGCQTCACKVDPQLAPSCQKPCWDFIACSFKAQSGKCATFAAGGDAMRAQFEACTMEECGAELAVPGAEVVSAYRSIIGACAVSMGDAKADCADDVTKFISELP